MVLEIGAVIAPQSRAQITPGRHNALSVVVIGASLLLVLFGYLPTLQFDYVTQDQWRAFRYSADAGSALERGTACAKMIAPFYVQTGRPLVWITECAEHAAVAQVRDFRLLRPISLTIAALTTVYLGSVLAPLIGSLAMGIVTAVAIVVAPGYSFMYLQGMPAAMVLVSLLCAAGSFRYYNQRRFVWSFSLFLAACLIYPAYAFVVISLALIEFGFSASNHLTARFWHFSSKIGFYFAASVIYYAFVKLMVRGLEELRGHLPILGTYDVTIQLTPAFLIERAKQAAAYFFAMPPLNFAVPAGTTVLIVLAFAVYVARRTTDARGERSVAALKWIVLFLVLAGVTLVMSISPWLFSNMENLSTRHLMPWYVFLCAIPLALLDRTIKGFSMAAYKWAPLIALIVVALPVTAAQYRLSRLEVTVTRTEIETMRVTLHEWVSRKGWADNRFLLVIMPTLSRPAAVDAIVGNSVYGNDNAMLASSRNPVSIPWMITALLRERPDRGKFELVDCVGDESCVSSVLQDPQKVALEYTYGREPIRTPVEPVVMNLSTLTARPVKPRIIQVASPTITASSILESYGPYGLLSAAQPGWHSERNPKYPQTLLVDFKDVREIHGVSFLPQDGYLSRMPKTGRISLSADSRTWKIVAEIDDLCIAPTRTDWRTVGFANPATGRFLRIEILGNCGDQTLLTLRGLNVE